MVNFSKTYEAYDFSFSHSTVREDFKCSEQDQTNPGCAALTENNHLETGSPICAIFSYLNI